MNVNSLLSLVECQVCFEVPRVARIYICVNGHSVCGKCKEKVDTCPQGRCAYANPPTRNHMVENILETGYYMVHCQNSKVGCSFEGPRVDTEKHEEECMFRNIECPLDCKMQVRAFDLYDHLESACSVKSELCPNKGCSERLRVSDVETHVGSSCPQRFIPCPLYCGMRSLRARNLEAHVANSCNLRIVECKNEGCGSRMTAMILSTHVLACGFRMVPCPKAPTCDVVMGINRRQYHVQSECRARMVECANKDCRKRITVSERLTHASACAFRIVPCQNAPYCDTKVMAGRRNLHLELECKAKAVLCKNSGCLFTGTKCVMLWHSSTCCFRMIECPNLKCGTVMRADIMKEVHELICPFKLVECKHWGCPTLSMAVLVPNHEIKCPFRLVKCRNQQCQWRAWASEIQKHETYYCPFRLVLCMNYECYEAIPFTDIREHDKQCHGRLDTCKNDGCSFSAMAFLVTNHAKHCSYRMVNCMNDGCTIVARANDIRTHEESCAFRIVEYCSSCYSNVRANEVMTHDYMHYTRRI